MIESLGAACHHIGQPATVITHVFEHDETTGNAGNDMGNNTYALYPPCAALMKCATMSSEETRMRLAMKHVLIVDDDLLVCRVLSIISQQYGHMVTVANDGQAAVNVLGRGKKFDGIFLDLILPFFSGWDVLRTIRADVVNRDARVVVMTGAALSEREKKKLLRDGDAFLSKGSFTIEGCRRLLRKMIEGVPESELRIRQSEFSAVS